MGNTYRLTEAQAIEAIEAAQGFISVAAEKMNITRSALYLRISKSPKLKQVIEDINEKSLDLSESKLRKLINEENLTAIIFHLKCKGKQRGYVERHELTGAEDVKIPAIKVSIVEPKALKEPDKK